MIAIFYITGPKVGLFFINMKMQAAAFLDSKIQFQTCKIQMLL